jgi:hypothetical protein
VSDVLLAIDPGRGRGGERLDELVGELQADLREIRGVAARRVTTGAQPGEKSGAVEQLGQLLLTGGAVGTTAWAIRDVLLRFMERTKAESVTIKKGDREITIVGPQRGQVDAIVQQVDALLRDD